ncbi:LysR substrate-binding domain-containing protein [Acetobacteraceae bacterium KSS12]|uniref:LysR substrate-binding domain-containing protein n=1 Tax=Rhizosaccharibacter radicis TaxID=2782605 RepID=A0ABT1W0R1_9PROT|nr:LysR substrate-binding domain-containing protein [Acetobacteraceae bacterium KSS12]
MAEIGSVSKAAKALGMSQPWVSQQLRKIEDELGRTLFRRNAHHMTITPDGEAFLAFARAMLSIGDAARRHFLEPRPDGPLRIGLVEGVARTLLMRVLGIFSRQFPQFAFDIVCAPSHRLFADLDEGRHDIVISPAPPGAMRGHLLHQFPLVWIGAAGEQLPVSDPVPLVLPAAPDTLREIAFGTLGDAGRHWRIAVQSDSLAAIEAAVAAGLGVSLTVRSVLLHEAVILDGTSGLPNLPMRSLTIDHAAGDSGTEALCHLLRSTFAQVIADRLLDMR